MLRAKIARSLRRLALLIEPQAKRRGPHGPAFERWLLDRGDATRRLDYLLTGQSVVWDVGGFEGEWASDIFGRFLCRIEVFEPSPKAIAVLRERFRCNPCIRIHEFGLGRANQRVLFAEADDATSMTDVQERSTFEATVRDVANVAEEFGYRDIALLKINIEGGEYDLIERLSEAGLLPLFDNIQVQFHDFVSNANIRRERAREKIAHTHDETWCYPFVWENWKRRS